MPDHNTLAFTLSQRLRRIVRTEPRGEVAGGWIIWLDTRNYVHGTYMHLLDNGEAYRITEREGEGPECFSVRPSDAEIEDMICRTHETRGPLA